MIFTKKDLTEKLGLDNEKVKLVMSFQKKLPILNDEGEGFCVNTRDLHEQLVIDVKIDKNGEKVQGTEFARWIKRRIDKYGFAENVDYITVFKFDDGEFTNEEVKNMSPQKRSSYGITEEYNITIDMAKELSMIENNEIGKIARKYFITIEKALKDKVKWNNIREPEKEFYKTMCKELNLYLQRNKGRKAEFYDYTNEANALNLVCLGARSKDILAYFEAKDKLTREHLLSEYNMYLSKMEELNIMYLRMNLDKEIRYNMIQQGFKALYPNATFVMANKQKEENIIKDIINN